MRAQHCYEAIKWVLNLLVAHTSIIIFVYFMYVCRLYMYRVCTVQRYRDLVDL